MEEKYNRKQAADQPINLRPIRQRQEIMIAIHLQRCGIKIRQGLVSYRTEISRARKTPSIKIHRVTKCRERRMECMRKSMNHIAQKIALKKGPTRNMSMKTWEGA